MGKPREWDAIIFTTDTEDVIVGELHQHRVSGSDAYFKVIEAAPALAALTAAEEALTAAVNVVDKRSPSWPDIDAALKLVRETLGVGPRWLDGKGK